MCKTKENLSVIIKILKLLNYQVKFRLGLFLALRLVNRLLSLSRVNSANCLRLAGLLAVISTRR